MILYDANVPAPNPYTVRLFIHERGGVQLNVKTIDLINLKNRSKSYREEVSVRGELPALRLDNGQVITEIVAICEYLDEVASGGRSLLGNTAEERAVTRMWTRRASLEIAEPFIAWWRGGEDAEGYYRGNRVLSPAGRPANRLMAERGLNQLDDDLDGRDFLCGDQPMLADILLFGFMVTMMQAVPWLNPPGRANVSGWFERMTARPATARAMQEFPEQVAL